MVVIGLAFAVVTFASNLFHVGPAFDRLTDGFRPIMTQQAIATDRADLAGLTAAGSEIQSKLMPAVAGQLKLTPAQFNQMMTTQFPDVAKGLAAIPTVAPTFSNLVTTLDQQRVLFNSADAIPTKSLPASTVPRAFLAVGLMAVGLGIVVWFTPRGAPVVAALLGACLVAVPLLFTMPHKASDADQLNANLKPVYTQQLVTQAGGAVSTLSAMGKQMQETMLPALAGQLHMQPAQMQSFLAQNFPATALALATLPAALGRFDHLVTTFDKHLSDYNTLKPVSFVPIVWMMIGGGAALFVLGAAGVIITWKRPTRLAEPR
jgi:hypothetical protein